MPLEFDHAVIAAPDLNAAMDSYQTQGFTVVRGGVHANRATENALIVFRDGTYLELLARTGEAPLPGMVDFSRMLASGGGVVGFALRAADLSAESARLRGLGFRVDDPIDGERRRADGVLVKWRLALIADGFTPFLIQDITPRRLRITDDPALTTHANGITGIAGIEIGAPDPAAAETRFAALFGGLQVVHAEQFELRAVRFKRA
jgi:catechol 2,3-dioxygenase-like lactoylglutathione lyase family enzyme